MLLQSRLKKIRGEKGIKQAEIAKFLEIDRTTYSKYETGYSQPDFDTLIKLAKYFDVTTDYLLGNSDFRSFGEYMQQQNKGNLSKEEKDLLSLYRRMTEKNKGKAELLLSQLLEKQEADAAKNETTASREEKSDKTTPQNSQPDKTTKRAI